MILASTILNMVKDTKLDSMEVRWETTYGHVKIKNLYIS